uniref:uncharacterized protein LOC120325937 n=1 Tax=Styela clava TaxID=7725 RepID=UPI00193ACBB1|nr:uncharacterized protein LOC120325937 [Styela clava]
MKISIIFILIFFITSSWSQDETVFHCSPKPGCNIAQCDSVAVGLDRPGFNIDNHLHDKEYPITCKSNSTVLSWLDLAARNLDITNIRIGLENLEDKFYEKIESFGKEISENNESLNQIGDQSTKINNLMRRTTKQSDEIRKLKKDLVEIREMNEKLVEDNEKMKKAISQIERKLSVMEKPLHAQNRSGQITRPTKNTNTTLKPTTKTLTTMEPTAKTRTTLKPTPPPENCKLKVGNICYFLMMPGKWDVVYKKAVDICKKLNANVGLIRNMKSYNAIMNYLRRNIPEGEHEISIWTGMKFNPMIGDVTPADSFIKWFPGDPVKGTDYKDRTNVYIIVDSNTNAHYQGMVNVPPTWKKHGVICEILI